MTRLPGFALQVRGWVAGFFDRASCPGEKLARIHAGHPSGFPPPTRRVIRGPLRAKSQEQIAKLDLAMLSRAPAPHPGPLPAGEREK
ncbi:hypothetical protein GCM10027021_01890 [Dyella kyungheensis]